MATSSSRPVSCGHCDRRDRAQRSLRHAPRRRSPAPAGRTWRRLEEARDDLDFESDPEFWEKIDRDPLMVAELDRQDADLAFLRDRPSLDAENVAHLRTASGSRGNLN